MDEIKAEARVYIKSGYGYTAYPNGYERFTRALSNTFGTVKEVLPKRQVKIMLDVNNGWAVIASLDCIVICNAEN